MAKIGNVSNKAKKDLVNIALQKAKILLKVIRDDNICVYLVKCKKEDMLIFADKHNPLYEVLLSEIGNKATNYETGSIAKIINHIKKLI